MQVILLENNLTQVFSLSTYVSAFGPWQGKINNKTLQAMGRIFCLLRTRNATKRLLGILRKRTPVEMGPALG